MSAVVQIRQSELYARWYAKLPDLRARARIDTRIRRLSLGNFGDVKAVGQGVSELRIDHGPGYRVYFCRSGAFVIILLAGGDKRTQTRDIARAQRMAKELGSRK